ncbi:MAG: serine--tRNA ligase [Hyphomicrobiales bacterium]
MYDIKWIRENPDAFDRGLKRRGLAPLSKSLLALDEQRRALITKLEQAQARRNSASKDIGAAKAKKDEATAQKLMAEVAELKTSIPAMEAQEKEASAKLEKELAQIPNLPLDDVPDGADEKGNVEHHKSGAKRDYAFKPKQHFDLGEALGMMDFEVAAKLSGARFVVLKGALARMERALGQLMLDIHTSENGYTEVNPPLMVRDEVMFGTAQLPKFAEDQFRTSKLTNREDIRALMVKFGEEFLTHIQLETDGPLPPWPEAKEMLGEYVIKKLGEYAGADANLLGAPTTTEIRFPGTTEFWLIPTAEVPLTNLVRESIAEEQKLPMRLTACTPCFRAEAGAAGKDTRGMIRQHQFTKVELVSITTPEQSKAEHERMLASAEKVLQKLDLHYRVVTLCTGDMGFAAQKTYDIEVWLPGEDKYREISSCSVCGEFQARRMNARYRAKDGVRHVHTLNGSGVAVGRALIAVMETYQQADGSIEVPKALAPYMGGMKKIEKAA